MLQDLAIGGQVQVVDERVMQMDATHRVYTDQAMTVARIHLQAKINGKAVMIKAKCQQQLNELKESVGEALQAMRDQVAEVQKSQDKMWGAISRMGDELRELAIKEDSLEFVDED